MPTDTNTFPSSRYFTATEFRCKCGGRLCDGTPADVDPLLILLLDRVRAALGHPVSVPSGLRCKGYNAEVYARYGKKPTDSRHSYGDAADISCPAVKRDDLLTTVRVELARLRREHPEVRGGLGYWMTGNRLHVDTRRDGGAKRPVARWSY